MTATHHVGLTVSDIDRSVDSYSRILGGTLAGSAERSGDSVEATTGYPGVVVKQAFVRPANSDTLMTLPQYVGKPPVALDPDNGSVEAVHVAVHGDDMDTAFARPLAEGVAALSEPITCGPGPMDGYRAVYVLDPDRIRAELVQARRSAG